MSKGDAATPPTPVWGGSMGSLAKQGTTPSQPSMPVPGQYDGTGGTPPAVSNSYLSPPQQQTGQSPTTPPGQYDWIGGTPPPSGDMPRLTPEQEKMGPQLSWDKIFKTSGPIDDTTMGDDFIPQTPGPRDFLRNAMVDLIMKTGR